VPFSKTRIPAERNDTVLFVGRIEATKGADLALAAARRASQPIILIGEGADHARLAAEYPEAHFAGRLAPPAIGALAATARMLVMPSRYPEPYGLVAMEAALSGLPVILPPTALLAAGLVTAGAAATVDPQDVAAHAALLSALAGDDARVAAMSRAGFTVTRHLALSPEEWLDRLLAHYIARLGPVQAPAAARSRSRSRSELMTAGA
jgi:glycosyltransferase involved in cell wall biosynthesis